MVRTSVEVDILILDIVRATRQFLEHSKATRQEMVHPLTHHVSPLLQFGEQVRLDVFLFLFSASGANAHKFIRQAPTKAHRTNERAATKQVTPSGDRQSTKHRREFEFVFCQEDSKQNARAVC